jgi:hypothetical protein
MRGKTLWIAGLMLAALTISARDARATICNTYSDYVSYYRYCGPDDPSEDCGNDVCYVDYYSYTECKTFPIICCQYTDQYGHLHTIYQQFGYDIPCPIQ